MSQGDEAFTRQMVAEGRSRCFICGAWTVVTTAGRLRKHKRQERGRWHMVDYDGSGANA